MKDFLQSTEVLSGSAMVAVGLVLIVGNVHGFLADALAPFGVGLILSDVFCRAAKAARDRARIPVRRDDD